MIGTSAIAIALWLNTAGTESKRPVNSDKKRGLVLPMPLRSDVPPLDRADLRHNGAGQVFTLPAV